MSASSQLCAHSTAGAAASSSPVLSAAPCVVVVGAGCAGLATALQLLQKGHKQVHVVTKDTTPNTTSDQAGALWRPFGEVSDSNRAVFACWGDETFTFLNEARLAHGSDATGICLVSGYEVFAREQTVPFWSKDVIGFRMLNRTELEAVGLHGHVAGFFYTSLIIDMAIYMAWLHRELARLGGHVHLRELACLSEVHTLFPAAQLIINSSGLGAATLVGDAATFPVAGHIVKVKCPSLHHFFMDSDATTYIFPRLHDVVCGGTYFKHNGDTRPNIGTRNDIISRVSQMVPELASSPIVGEYVGLRPYRDVTRLELEYPHGHPNAHNQKLLSSTPLSPKVLLPVIHNYGHGGSGVTLHWGCGKQVVDLALPFLSAPTILPTNRLTSKL